MPVKDIEHGTLLRRVDLQCVSRSPNNQQVHPSSGGTSSPTLVKVYFWANCQSQQVPQRTLWSPSDSPRRPTPSKTFLVGRPQTWSLRWSGFIACGACRVFVVCSRGGNQSGLEILHKCSSSLNLFSGNQSCALIFYSDKGSASKKWFKIVICDFKATCEAVRRSYRELHVLHFKVVNMLFLHSSIVS